MLIAAADKLLINKNKYVRCKEQKCAPIFGWFSHRNYLSVPCRWTECLFTNLCESKYWEYLPSKFFRMLRWFTLQLMKFGQLREDNFCLSTWPLCRLMCYNWRYSGLFSKLNDKGEVNRSGSLFCVFLKSRNLRHSTLCNSRSTSLHFWVISLPCRMQKTCLFLLFIFWSKAISFKMSLDCRLHPEWLHYHYN
jgi:hypothetical protein